MNKEQVMKYGLSKGGAYLDFPFVGNDYAVIKIKNEKTGKNRIFAEIFSLNDLDMLTFSADKDLTINLRNQYPDKIKKGYHCPPVQAQFKSSLVLTQFDDITIKQFIDLSYEFAKFKLKTK